MLSLLKKISLVSTSGSNKDASNNKTDAQANLKENVDIIKTINLPSWKDNAIWSKSSSELQTEEDRQCLEIKEAITDLLRTIRDPEKPNTLEDLEVITDDSVRVQKLGDDGGYYLVRIDFNPTVPHCSLASLIGLCLRGKIRRDVVERIKLDIVIAEGKHSTEEEINKQINDKERVAAAMENPNLKEIVNSCIEDQT